jgi:hypothetical protein
MPVSEGSMTAGNVAYVAYGQQVNWRSVHGEVLPMWHELDDRLRGAWDIAAERAIEWRLTGKTTLTRPESP